jgi:hypothetical protein
MIMWKGDYKEVDEKSKRQFCTVQGTVSIGCYPRYRQIGDDDTVRFKDQYFCVKINEAKVFGEINDGGDALVWVECNWGGVVKKTR